MKTYAGNIKKGEFIEYQGDPWAVQKTEFYSPGKGSALMKLKIKNVATGKNIDYTFKSNEDVEVLDVASTEMQYLYKDNEFAYFMDERTYNQYQIAVTVVGDVLDFMKEGDKVYVYVYNDQAIAMRPPMSVRVKVVETDDAVKGDTVTGGKKTAKVETGGIVMVPLFIKVGEMITVNPETKEYTGRDNS